MWRKVAGTSNDNTLIGSERLKKIFQLTDTEKEKGAETGACIGWEKEGKETTEEKQ